MTAPWGTRPGWEVVSANARAAGVCRPPLATKVRRDVEVGKKGR